MKTLICILLSFMLCIALLTGCGQNSPAISEAMSETSKPVDISEQSSDGSIETTAGSACIDCNTTYDYEVREIWLSNNGQKIYGEAYVPITDSKVPLVIHSHGLGANHESGASYGKKYAKRGIAVYAPDFRGGSNSNNENRSDGVSTEMSVMTEVSDVETALEAAKTWDFVDTDRIFLQGGSQGGLVTAIAGIRHEDELAGIILHYPAFGIYDFVHSYSNSYDDFPKELTISSMVLSQKYGQDIWDYDVRKDIPSFHKSVLILQGSKDNLVTPASSEAAHGLYPNSEYHIIEGADHGFSGEYHDKATEYGIEFIYKII